MRERLPSYLGSEVGPLAAWRFPAPDHVFVDRHHSSVGNILAEDGGFSSDDKATVS